MLDRIRRLWAGLRDGERSNEEIILLSLCAISIPSILPFGIVRLLTASYAAAVVDIGIVLSMIAVMSHVWRTGRTRLASLAISGIYSTGMVVIVYLHGISLVYWAYPTMVASFFTLPPKRALTINLTALACMVGLLSHAHATPTLTLATFSVTVALINLFSYIVFYRTHLQVKELNLRAERDFLTGAGNRRALQRTLMECASSSAPCSLLLLDIDHFKRINDQYGHSVGDAVLVSVSALIHARIRANDRLFRYGGEEFLIVAKGTPAGAASCLAEDLRALVERAAMIQQQTVTVSIGIATLRPGEPISEWVARADERLYAAKAAGRNCIQTG
ncbi:GGDEF domain-containing protein [Amantichitinum ursilacus]|uniref:GGDEF domain-containing protein n=1 Tax=Amantichitinum ursilacus TaxID=857265 RepID=UPI0006B45B06|nr:GGDEF domain-containing protein [Amantichitinum ursilacus]